MNLSEDLNGCSVFSVLELMPNSFSEVENFANIVIENVKDGYKCPLKIWAQMNHLESLIKKIKEGIENTAINEADKYDKKEMPIVSGFQFSVVPTSTKYDFANCGDSVFNQLSVSEKLIKEQVKERTDWLKTLKMPAINEETGEIINPPVKEQKLGLKLNKK